MSEGLSTALAKLLERELADFRSLLACEQLTAGASQETYQVVIETPSGTRQFALRRSQPLLDAESNVGNISLATEARLFELAGRAGIPGPKIHYVLQPEDGMGSGFLMDWVSGETLGQRIVRVKELADVRPRLAGECGRILGRIHALDWAAAGLDTELPHTSPKALVTETWEIYRDLHVPVPMIDYCYRWLIDHAPGDSRTTLVHGDFRNGNLMVTPEGVAAVLDWELAQIGDPIRDLGWLCVNSWRFGKDALPVGGFGTVEDLLDGYRQVSGIDVSHAELKYWQVFGSFWWAMATLQMANAWRTGETPSLERPVIGRRSSEAQMDCVNLLIPGQFELPQMDADTSIGTQLPMPAELLSGVADFLGGDFAGQLDSRSGFLAKVAANSLGIAQRELQHGAHLANQERRRLQALLGSDAELDELRWGLVNKLRDGMPLDSPGLAEHLRQTVACQLAIDQPRYSALRQSNPA
ncbi:phosphotransferase family protein [Congregibacter variabilis]|uniref:Phosphotransferase family protein n=1 Tax=Congregibacter variabilis TaxID=3081200 RepID=A0ABZ0I7H2_9GAMM|nr:phosphotransferase family protein [Congregibacter sp. IMCC43200]